MLKLPWMLNSVITGVLFGFGVVLVNSASRSAVPLSVTLFLFGVVWVVSSLPIVSASGVTALSLRTAVLIALAAGLFFAGNFFQFTATLTAPASGYALLVITAVTFMVTFAYDAVRLYREGKVIISVPEITGVGLVSVGLVILVLFSKK